VLVSDFSTAHRKGAKSAKEREEQPVGVDFRYTCRKKMTDV
jgi:hypothetical protein